MPCAQTLSGLARDCNPNMCGIKAAWINNFDEVSGLTVGTSSDDKGKITAITLVNHAAAGATDPVYENFKKYTFRPATSNFESTLNASEENGPQDVTTLINLVFGRMETTKRIEMEALSLADLAMIVQDSNDVYWYFGKDNPVFASTANGGTGTARSDRNGYGITLQDNAKTWPFEVKPDAVADAVDEL